MKRLRASADDVVAALLLPQPRRGQHDRIAEERPLLEDTDGDVLFGVPRSRRTAERKAKPTPPRPRRVAGAAAAVPTALPREVERDLAALAGVDSLPPAEQQETEPVPVHVTAGNYAGRLLRVAQLVTVGAFALMTIAAVCAAKFGSASLTVHEIPFAAWGLVAAVAALWLADLTGRTDGGRAAAPHQRVVAAVLLAVLVAAVTGVVASADGVAGPAWVLFLPVVLVTGAVAGRTVGLAVGASAAGGVYTAALLTHTLTVAGVGRLVVLLPVFPAAGWSAGALARLAHSAATEAQVRREALETDVRALSDLLGRVAAGDLSRVPAVGEGADPVTTSMAVAFADTLLALRRLVRQMDGVADQLATRALDLAGTAEQDAAATEAQVSAVAETTTTVEQLAATAGTIAETAVRVSQFAGTTRRDVDTGAHAVQESTLAMDRIATTVGHLADRTEGLRDRIGQIAMTTRMIDELARRTSILAVNASIEAARAGDHGHGFHNVAAEVTTLATRARDATSRISGIVAELEAEARSTADATLEGLDAVQVGIELQEDVVAALARIGSMVDRTTHAAREISEATRQQRAASDAVVSAMTTVTAASDRYREGSRRHAAAAVRLRDLATDLRNTLGRFKVR